jgi:hypothetical protein
MYVACARAGNESHFGDTNVFIYLFEDYGALSKRRRAASFQDARPRRSTADFHTRTGRDTGKTHPRKRP